MKPATEEQITLAKGPAIWALSASMTLAYSALYYTYAGLILFWQRDPGWSKSLLASGPMVSMLLAALLVPLTGRLVDRGRGPEALMAGPVLGAIALIALTFVTQPWQWIAVWLVIGLAQALCFYEVGFAFLIRRLGAAGRIAIIRVTLVAGFASTICFPAYAAFGNGPGWRAAIWTAAGLLVFAVLPLNWYATRIIRREAPAAAARAPASTAPAAEPPPWRSIALLALLSSCVSINHWMIVTYIVPILVAQGYSEAAAVFAASLLGPAQVLARFALMWADTRVSTTTTLKAILAAMLLASFAIISAWAGIVAGTLYALLQGAAFGAMTIVRPMLIADTMGAENYGVNAGKVLTPTLIAGALSPMLGAVMLEQLGLSSLIALSCVLMVTAWLALRRLPIATG